MKPKFRSSTKSGSSNTFVAPVHLNRVEKKHKTIELLNALKVRELRFQTQDQHRRYWKVFCRKGCPYLSYKSTSQGTQ